MSQQKISLLTLGVVAGGALADGRAVTLAGAYPSAKADAFGITTTSASGSGERVPTDVIGTTIAVMKANCSKGASLEVSSDGGKLQAFTDGVVVAVALEANGDGDGGQIEVLLV